MELVLKSLGVNDDPKIGSDLSMQSPPLLRPFSQQGSQNIFGK